ncbi:MAG: hypothetical protein KF729_06315 [Sandaracinaceae bacterium]|nr:hypothetical protein [Sandaracinaceae bacterium]
MRLAPCSGCRRHVGVGAPRCPFCGASTRGLTARAPRHVERLTRAAILYFGATLASGCGPDSQGRGEEEPVLMPYGAPPLPPDDEGTSRRAPDDTVEDPPAPVYGGPPDELDEPPPPPPRPTP